MPHWDQVVAAEPSGAKTAGRPPLERGAAPVVVAVPLYRPTPSADERLSLVRLFSLLGDRDIVFLHPESMDTSAYRHWPAERLPLADRHFRSSASYSRLLLSTGFYSLFSEYEFVLIHQTDVFLCHADLELFTNSGMDYIGAPWLAPLRCPVWCLRGARFLRLPGLTRSYSVGNGGLSLRRVGKMIEVIEGHRAYSTAACITGTHEDIFFASLVGDGPSRLRIPQLEVALTFAFDRDPRACYAANGDRLPFGLHNPWGYDRQFFVAEVLPQCGLDHGCGHG